MVLKHTQTTHSRISYQGNSWKSTGHTQEGGKVTENGVSTGQTFRSLVAVLTHSKPFPHSHKATERMPCTGSYLMLHPTQFIGTLRQVPLVRQKLKAVLHNTQKQTQGGCQIEETKKYGPNEGIKQNSRKRTKRNRDRQPIRCRVQNTGDQDAQKTH